MEVRMSKSEIRMVANFVITNGKPDEAKLPCTVEEFLVAQGLSPRRVLTHFAFPKSR